MEAKFKRLFIIVVFSVLAITNPSLSGELRLYDANSQFIGICIDNCGENDIRVYIPEMSVFATFNNVENGEGW